MPDPTPLERLQPCLLDRLTDDAPTQASEGRDQRVISLPRFRAAVLRDIAWLLNTPGRADFEEIAEFPQAAGSVVNFGMGDLCGRTSSGLAGVELERSVRKILERFEPRLIRRSLSVRVLRQEDAHGPTAIVLEISGEIWANPVPESLYIRTEFDLDTGECRIAESGRG